jgi:hypothetical protein
MFKLKKSIIFIICMLGLSMIFFNCNNESPVSTSTKIKKDSNRDKLDLPTMVLRTLIGDSPVWARVVLHDPNGNIVFDGTTNAGTGCAEYYYNGGEPEPPSGWYHAWAIWLYGPYEGVKNFYYYYDPETETIVDIYLYGEDN